MPLAMRRLVPNQERIPLRPDGYGALGRVGQISRDIVGARLFIMSQL